MAHSEISNANGKSQVDIVQSGPKPLNSFDDINTEEHVKKV